MKARLLFLFLLMSLCSVGQPLHEYIVKGDFYLTHNFFREAVDMYLKAQAEDDLTESEKLITENQLAEAYYKLFDYANAEIRYANVVNNFIITDPTAWLRYGHILRNNEKYEQAREAYQMYADYTGSYSEADYYDLACNWALEHDEVPARTHIYPTNIETGGRSFGVAYYKDGLIYSKAQSSDFDIRTTFYDLCYSRRQNDSLFEYGDALKGNLNKSFYEGTPAITADGKKMYYSGNASERTSFRKRKRNRYEISSTGVNVLKIFEVTEVDGEWIEKRMLNFNDNEYSCTHPTISTTGDTMYFVSNMPGGYGGFDLYRSIKSGTIWSTPENLGPSINTEGNEMTPFLHGNELYFSSKGLMGFGGADIFLAQLYEGEFISIRNMGRPYNTSKDDFAFVLRADGKKGFLSSNRSGDNGYDYVFAFDREVAVEHPDTIRGIAINRFNGKPIANVLVSLDDTLVNAFIDGDRTDSLGRLTMVLPKERTFQLLFSAEGYEPKTIAVPANDRSDVIAKLGNLELVPKAEQDKVIVVDKIYFDYDKANIRDESTDAMNKVLEYLLYYPDIKVELSAHTDARGSDSYNQNLSQKRAESTVAWLIEKGISKDRLVPVGYGESKPVNHCVNGVDCSDELHEQNRRVEMKILDGEMENVNDQVRGMADAASAGHEVIQVDLLSMAAVSFYSVQVGSFATLPDLTFDGLAITHLYFEKFPTGLYKVFVGQFASANEMREGIEALKAGGLSDCFGVFIGEGDRKKLSEADAFQSTLITKSAGFQ